MSCVFPGFFSPAVCISGFLAPVVCISGFLDPVVSFFAAVSQSSSLRALNSVLVSSIYCSLESSSVCFHLKIRCSTISGSTLLLYLLLSILIHIDHYDGMSIGWKRAGKAPDAVFEAA